MKVTVSLCILVCMAVAGCATRAPSHGDGLAEYRLPDGTVCRAPSGFADLVDSDGTRQMRSLFLASAEPREVAASISVLPSRQEIDAAMYQSCGEFARSELSQQEFERQRRLYQHVRIEHLSRGIQQWRDDPAGYDTAGKVCSFLFAGDQPDPRNVTRLVPQETAADDCAVYVHMNGGSHVLLGCSEGRWNTRWAVQPMLVGPNGWSNRRDSPVGTRYVPEANCGWR